MPNRCLCTHPTVYGLFCLLLFLVLSDTSVLEKKKKKNLCFLSLLSFGFKETKENTTVCLALWYRWHSFSHSAKSVSKLTCDLLKWSCDHWNEQQRKPQEQALNLHVFCCCCCCGFCFFFFLLFYLFFLMAEWEQFKFRSWIPGITWHKSKQKSWCIALKDTHQSLTWSH